MNKALKEKVEIYTENIYHFHSEFKDAQARISLHINRLS